MAASTSAAAGFAGEVLQACGELGGAGREVLGDEVEDLRAVVGGGVGPACGGVRGLDRVADVLAVADADLAEELALGEDGLGVAAIRACLLAADVELGGAVEGRGLPGRRTVLGHGRRFRQRGWSCAAGLR